MWIYIKWLLQKPANLYLQFKKKLCSAGQGLTWLKKQCMLIDFSITVKAATLIFLSGRGSTISSAKKGKSGFI